MPMGAAGHARWQERLQHDQRRGRDRCSRRRGRSESRLVSASIAARPVTVALAPTLRGRSPTATSTFRPGTFLYGSAADEDTRRSFLSTYRFTPACPGVSMRTADEVPFAEWLAFVDANRSPRAALVAASPDRSWREWRRGRSRPDGWHLFLASRSRAAIKRGERADSLRRARPSQLSRLAKFPVLGIPQTMPRPTRLVNRSGQLSGARLCTELEWDGQLVVRTRA